MNINTDRTQETEKKIEGREHFHGSDLERIEREYGIRKEEIVRFGANVNPLGLSEKFKTALAEKLDVITSYPDREYNRLREVIAAVPERNTSSWEMALRICSP